MLIVGSGVEVVIGGVLALGELGYVYVGGFGGAGDRDVFCEFLGFLLVVLRGRIVAEMEGG